MPSALHRRLDRSLQIRRVNFIDGDGFKVRRSLELGRNA
jgi:hypothetical protein